MSDQTHDQEAQVAQVDEVDRETGEVKERGRDVSGMAMTVRTERPPLPTFASGAMLNIVRDLASPEALEAQTRMSKAYDEACQALLSPNDYQEEGGRQFKKKSAWRKMGRAFGISTEILHVDGRWVTEYDEHLGRPFRHFLASATVRATAPWGQVMEQVGMCGTRESRFYTSGAECPNCGGPMWDNRDKDWGGDFGCKDKNGCGTVLEAGQYDETLTGKRPNKTARGKAEHDCTSTAVTRATNRAISDLVAAGEVSAEEVEGGDEGSFQRGDSGQGQGQRQGNQGGGNGGTRKAPSNTDPMSDAQSRKLFAHARNIDELEGTQIATDWVRTQIAEGSATIPPEGPGEEPRQVLTKAEASKLIERLMKREEEARANAAGDIGAKEAAAIEAEEAAEEDGEDRSAEDWEEELFQRPEDQPTGKDALAEGQ